MDDQRTPQLQVDFRTGLITAIDKSLSTDEQRAACISLNRGRARGFQEAARFAAPRESTTADVWVANASRVLDEWDVPFIDLANIGIDFDEMNLPSSSDLETLRPGAEASPYLDHDNQCVYKLFDLRVNGSLGKKLTFRLNAAGGYELNHADSTLLDTVEKLMLLNDCGALPTEIVGLSDDKYYLIVKQPRAFFSEDYESDKAAAIDQVFGIVPPRGRFRKTTGVILDTANVPWFLSDLHPGNIMKDKDGCPTIIDALVGAVPPLAIKRFD